VRGQNAGCLIEFPNKNLIQSEIHVQNESTGAIGLDHVGVCAVMTAEGEASRWSVGGLLRSDGPGIALHVGGGAETTVGEDRQDRNAAAKVVGHEEKFSGRMNA